MENIALIGNGYWGTKLRKYIPSFFNLKHIANSKFDKNIIWDDKDVKSIIIATPIATHYAIVKEALLHNKNVFVEKPITLHYDEACELKALADELGLELGVDYILTFSKSVLEVINKLENIGDIEFIDMANKRMGRFTESNDVYWLLGSHLLSVLGLIVPLDEIKLDFYNYMYYNRECTNGSMMFSKGRMDVSLHYPGRELYFNIYGTKGIIKCNLISSPTFEITLYKKKHGSLQVESGMHLNFNESDNLLYSMKYFYNLIQGKVDPNIDLAIRVTELLENRSGVERGDKSC